MGGRLIWSTGPFVIALLLFSLACGGDTLSNKATSTPAATNRLSAYATEKALPVATSRPSSTALVVGPAVRPCAASDLLTSISSNALTGGQLLLGIALGNRSGSACQISQLPNIQLLDAQSHALPVTVSAEGEACPPCAFQQPLLLLPDLGDIKPHVALRPGQGWVELEWATYDGAGVCLTPPPIAMAVRLLLPDDGGAVTVDVTSEFPSGIAPCHWPVQIFAYGPGTSE